LDFCSLGLVLLNWLVWFATIAQVTTSHLLHGLANFFGKLGGEKQPWEQKPASTPLPDMGDGAKEFDGVGNAQVSKGFYIICNPQNKYGEYEIVSP
jgi:hypothetical protein